jgi:hypothetical protein
MEDTSPIGYLFNSIAFYKQDDVDALIDNMTIEQSFYVLTQAMEQAHNSKIYNLQESELLSKSYRIISKVILDQNIVK